MTTLQRWYAKSLPSAEMPNDEVTYSTCY